MDFDETWYGWSTQDPLQVLLCPGADPQRGQIRPRGPLFQRTSSSDRKAKATNQKHSSDLEAFRNKCCYFLFYSQVKFLARFDVFQDFVILVNFDAREASATNKIHDSIIKKHLGRSVVIFGFIWKSNFWRVFDVCLDLVNSISCILMQFL